MTTDLNVSVSTIALVGPSYSKKLERLGIITIEDLITHIPRRYLDFRKSVKISELKPDEVVYLKGEVVSSVNQYTKKGSMIQISQITDGVGKISAIWFNQPFLSRILYPGVKISIAGKVGWFNRKLAFLSPEYEKLEADTKGLHTQGLVPVYPETSGISSKWIRRRITDVLDGNFEITEFLPDEILKEYKLINYPMAIRRIHAPKNEIEIEEARKRLAFNELLMLQLANSKRKKKWEGRRANFTLKINDSELENFISKLPFKLTDSQKSAIYQIVEDLKKDKPMNRLLEGDVGSGKTVVAAAIAYLTLKSGFQSVFLAPTQILATQHYETLKKLFEPFNARVKLFTSVTSKEKFESADIFVGTHSLLNKNVKMDKVGLVVIDEQHRFGVKQREVLIKKTGAPHVLTMTATPIPQTVAMTYYGDLDISTLLELPSNRIPVTTWVLKEEKRLGAYKWINEEIEKYKSQTFVICPLIDESDVETIKEVKAAKSEFEKLTQIFKNKKVGLLHGRVKAKEKDEILNKFRKGEIDILVATPIVEVGIDIPNATIMLIEAADRYGLAQLHQLRGRVGRGTKKSYCLLFTENTSEKIQERLMALRAGKTGHELAELDLSMRGPGEIFGTRQSGFPELKIANWSDIELIKSTKELAHKINANPKKYATLTKKDKQISQIDNLSSKV